MLGLDVETRLYCISQLTAVHDLPVFDKESNFASMVVRGFIGITVLLFLSSEQLMQLYCARQRRRLNRGLRRKQQSLLKRLRKAKKEAPPMEKPEVVKTHLRDMVILPEMVGSMVGVYNGKTFNQVEIKVRRCWLGVSKNTRTFSNVDNHTHSWYILQRACATLIRFGYGHCLL